MHQRSLTQKLPRTNTVFVARTVFFSSADNSVTNRFVTERCSLSFTYTQHNKNNYKKAYDNHEPNEILSTAFHKTVKRPRRGFPWNLSANRMSESIVKFFNETTRNWCPFTGAKLRMAWRPLSKLTIIRFCHFVATNGQRTQWWWHFFFAFDGVYLLRLNGVVSTRRCHTGYGEIIRRFGRPNWWQSPFTT